MKWFSRSAYISQEERGKAGYANLLDEKGQHVGRIENPNHGTLAAAAPDLLYAVQRAIGDYEHLERIGALENAPMARKTYPILLDALARAEGRIA